MLTYKEITTFPLDRRKDFDYNTTASRCGEVWYRAWFGSKRPRVRIPTLRPKMKTAHLGGLLFSLSKNKGLPMAALFIHSK